MWGAASAGGCSPRCCSCSGCRASGVTALMRSAAEQGSDTQCGAGAARLRRLARRLPAKAQSLDHLADILTAPDQPEPAPGHSTVATDTTATTP